MNKNKLTAEEGKKALEDLFPDKKLLVFAIEDIDFSDPNLDLSGVNPGIFSLSTITTKSDVMQMAIMLATDSDFKNLFETIVALSQDMLSREEIKDHLGDILVKE